MNELELLEESTSKATNALMTIAKMTGDFSSNTGLELFSVQALKTIFGDLLTNLAAAQSPKSKRRPVVAAKLPTIQKPAAVESTDSKTPQAIETQAAPAQEAAPAKKNKGGRPKGSTNKPKQTEAVIAPEETTQAAPKNGASGDPLWD